MTDQLTVVAAEAASAGTPGPPAGSVLSALRGDSRRRLRIDPGLAGGLREWLEDGLCSLPMAGHLPLVVTKQKLRDAFANRSSDPEEAEREVTGPMALGAIVDALFRQFVTTGTIDDPMRDGLEGLGIDPRRSRIVDFVQSLQGQSRVDFQDEVETQCAILISRWPRLSPYWFPRTQERIAVPLAGGDVSLVGVIDLLVGTPSTGRASVGVIEVKSGQPRPEDRDDLRFYALLETLRSGAAPFRVATFYSRTGQVDAEDVVDELLTGSVHRVLAGVSRMIGAN